MKTQLMKTDFLILLPTLILSFCCQLGFAQNSNLIAFAHNSNTSEQEQEMAFFTESRSNQFEETSANCFCVVSYNDLTNQTSRSGVCLDLTSRINLSFSGIGQQSPTNQRHCDRRCSDAVAALSQSELQAIANCACAAGIKNNSVIRGWSALGMRKYSSAYTLGRLINTPAQYRTVCSCPTGWTIDDGQTDINRKCKKAICTVASPVANTELPRLPGFIWNNTIYQWIKGECIRQQTAHSACKLVR